MTILSVAWPKEARMGQSLQFHDSLENQDDPTSPGLARLADQLVKSLGVKDALLTCRENSWYGVQQIIQHRMGKRSNS